MSQLRKMIWIQLCTNHSYIQGFSIYTSNICYTNQFLNAQIWAHVCRETKKNNEKMRLSREHPSAKVQLNQATLVDTHLLQVPKAPYLNSCIIHWEINKHVENDLFKNVNCLTAWRMLSGCQKEKTLKKQKQVYQQETYSNKYSYKVSSCLNRAETWFVHVNSQIFCAPESEQHHVLFQHC